MKFDTRWLKEKVNFEGSYEQLCKQLTLSGFEVESCEPFGNDTKDAVLEVAITPNRGDCMSVLGIAREIAALQKILFSPPLHNPARVTTDTVIPVEIEEKEACPHYVGRVIKNINPRAKTPDWIAQRLERSGIRTISPVVDITNYVMLDLGQPLHAFDLEKIGSGIRVRFAHKDESLQLLDGQEINLSNDTLVIASQNKTLAIAGVMGGLESSVTDDTKNIFLESAFFEPKVIAGRARRYGLFTDSAQRFQRGVDPALQVTAIEYATELLLNVVGGEVAPLILQKESQNSVFKKRILKLRHARIDRVTGVNIEKKTIEKILQALGCCLTQTEEGWEVEVPSYRFDLTIEEDLIEEIIRVYGYDNLSDSTPSMPVVLPKKNPSREMINTLQQALLQRGYHEVITYSFIDPKICESLRLPYRGFSLTNPISSELSEMRTSIWPGLLKTLTYNLNHQQQRLRLFEIGKCFISENQELHQPTFLSGLVFGEVFPPQWGVASSEKKTADFFDIKNDVESLLKKISTSNRKVRFSAETHPSLHPAQSAKIYIDGDVLGWIGQLHPEIAHQLDLAFPVYLFELSIEYFLNLSSVPVFQELSKYPSLRRDLSFLISEKIESAAVLSVVRKNSGEYLQHLELFDVYQGKGMPEGKKSMALSLVLQHPDRTLLDEEADVTTEKVIKSLEKEFSIVMRI